MAMTILPFFSCLILVSTNQVLSTHQSAELALDTHVQVRVNLNLFFAKKQQFRDCLEGAKRIMVHIAEEKIQR